MTLSAQAFGWLTVTIASIAVAIATLSRGYQRVEAFVGRSQREQEPNTPPQMPNSHLHVTHDVGLLLVKSGESVDIRVPIVNRLDVPVRFSDPECGCSCRAAVWSKSVLSPGDRTELVVSTKAKGSSESTVFLCRWKDDAGREWSSQCRVELLPDESFAENRFQHFNLRPGTRFRDRVLYRQHAPNELALPPLPSFLTTDEERLKIISRKQATESLGGGWVRRTVALEVEVQAGQQAGYHTAQLLTDRSMASVAFEWQVKQLIQSSPANLVLTHKDFESGRLVRRSFLLRSLDGPVRISSVATQGLPNDLVRISVRSQDGGVAVIDVEARWAGETRSGSVVVTTGVAECPRIAIPVVFIADATNGDLPDSRPKSTGDGEG